MKYSWKYKLECVNKHKNGEYIEFIGASKQRDYFMNLVRKWIKYYDDLGVDGLKHSSTHKDWTPEKRFDLVVKVLAGNSIASVAKNVHIDDGQLYQ